MKQYKFLSEDLVMNGFQYVEGEWTPSIQKPELCETGYHTCTKDHLLDWCDYGLVLYECEVTGASDGPDDDGKTAWESIRLVRRIEGWNERTARLFAVWCARQALKLIDNPDPRSIAACDVAERFANGEATVEELSAARAAAWAAARDAARAAAWAAARDAARAAAWDAARDAAWAAARDAAWAAAGAAARYAAWAAARDAARDAARYAAWAAARNAQYQKLYEMIGLEG